jgi:hypothetical protein
MILLRLLAVLLLVAPSPVVAGLRAVYGNEGTRPLAVEIADNGDFVAELSPDRRLLVRGEDAYLVEERLTGPLVTRVADLRTLVERRRGRGWAANPANRIRLVARGPMEVNGRSGTAYVMATLYGDNPEEVVAVISHDRALEPLGRAMRRVQVVEHLLEEIETGLPRDQAGWQAPLDALVEAGTPLRLWGRTLRTIEQATIHPAALALPAEPESPAAVAARYDPARQEAEDAAARETQMISRAVFGAGRLWLLTDSAALSSLAEGETRRTAHDLGGPVIDICEQAGTLLAVTGRGRERRGPWTLRRLVDGRWQTGGTIAHEGDALVALSCSPGDGMLVTSRRLIDLGSGRAAARLSEALRPSLVRSVVHVTQEAVFVGINAGEWGGGLRRIDRRTGRVATIERNATGELCDGPLNASCDPVNGLATIPWRPDCIAGAVGLIHMMAHGRIAQICPGSVEQLIAVADVDELDPEDARRRAEASVGGYGSVAFFGLAARGDELIAVGHNGIHRIRADGSTVHQRWPRFVEVDGVYVSFALPDVVLVLTQLNRRASVSGSSPLLVVR